jgi:hypothetical protein
MGLGIRRHGYLLPKLQYLHQELVAQGCCWFVRVQIGFSHVESVELAIHTVTARAPCHFMPKRRQSLRDLES